MFCAEGATFLNTSFTTVVLLGRAMIQNVTAETRDRFQVNACEFGVGWSGNGMDFSPSNSVLLYQYHPTRCQYLSSRCTLQKESDLTEIRSIAGIFSAAGNWHTFRIIKFSVEVVFSWIHEISKFVMIKTKVGIIILIEISVVHYFEFYVNTINLDKSSLLFLTYRPKDIILCLELCFWSSMLYSVIANAKKLSLLGDMK